MLKHRKKTAESFSSNGTEGMLDVVLGCTLIFLLMSSLIRVGDAEQQEKMLPAVNLTGGEVNTPGVMKIKKRTITMKQDSGTTKLFLDKEPVSMKTLKQALLKMAGGGHIALRRDRKLPCEVEDKIILMCKNAGIEKVAIIVGASSKNK
tara:strand:+ start:273 stop:719 length:447 start_codon:yes stop_codon:yes gene_type:complete